MMYQVAQRRANSTAASHVLLSFITAPILTLSTSLQISLPKNLVTLEKLQTASEQSQLKKASFSINQLNLRDKQELVKQNRQSAVWRPYRPVAYSNYLEAMKGVYKQGTPSAFYKGNMTRGIHILLFHKLNTDLTFRVEQGIPDVWKKIKEIPLAAEFLLSCSVDLCL